VTPPSAPAGLTATPTGSTSAGLVWQASTDDVGVVGYEVRRDGVVLGILGGLTYTATGLTPSTTYGFEVVALDAAGNRSAASSVVVTTAPAVTPVVTASTSWRFLDTGVDPGASWTTAGFDDSAWRTGLGQFGYGDGDEASVVGFGPDASRKHVVTWFRTTFTVEDPTAVRSLTLQLLRDDGAAVHLNGVEVHRSNLPDGPLSATTRALTNVDGAAERVWHVVTLPASALVPGVNVLAVSVHQQWASSSDLSFDLRLDLNG
jgi:chitodextrinase